MTTPDTQPQVTDPLVGEPTTLAAVTLDLDAMERPGPVIEMFTFRHLGKVYALLDPALVDWKDILAGLRNPAAMFRVTLDPKESLLDFMTAPMPGWKLEATMRGYFEHYGLKDVTTSGLLGGLF